MIFLRATLTLKKASQLFQRGCAWLILVLSVMTLSACQFLPYQAKPIQPETNTTEFRARNPNSPQFSNYLQSMGVSPSQWPIRSWDRDLLSYCALFYHPDLDVARAQWKAAQAAQITAGQKPEIGAGGRVENHSNNSNMTPWTYGMGIDIYVITAGKIEIRIDRAASLSEAAKINIAQTAWQVRTRAIRSLLQYQYNQQLIALLKQELSLRQEIVEMLQKRLDAGIASNVDLNNARIFMQKTEQAYVTELGRQPALLAALANDIGLSVDTLKQMQLPSLWQEEVTDVPQQDDKSLQTYALQNRLDIRAALARYEAAESGLRLEIAKQYPDFVLSPSYVFDQNDRIWSLGINSLLTLVNRNRGLIAEANALRDVEATQFFALQTRVIRQIEMQQATVSSVKENLKRADEVLTVQSQRFNQTQQQFDTGVADRLELTGGKLEILIAQQNRLNLSYQLQQAVIELEDGLQRPLDGVFKLPNSLQNKVSEQR